MAGDRVVAAVVAFESAMRVEFGDENVVRTSGPAGPVSVSVTMGPVTTTLPVETIVRWHESGRS
jgi:hypothetical protein